MTNVQQLIIKQINVSNFKSLVDFELPLAKFSCLIGPNGAGKSTVLQFFDFLSQQVHGNIKGWLNQRQWEASDINSKLISKRNVEFEVCLSTHQGIPIRWKASFNRSQLRCTSERIWWNEQDILKVQAGKYTIWNLIEGKRQSRLHLSNNLHFNYQGSVLSQIKESELNQV